MVCGADTEVSIHRDTRPGATSLQLLFVYLFVGTAFLFLATPVSGQERPIPLDTVEVQANSRASPALGTRTRAIEVITADEIRKSTASTIAEALEWGVGLELTPRSPANGDVALRGASFEQVLILVDGVRMRDPQTGHFNLNLAVPLQQVERIEVMRGPAASLYGSDAMAGVINIVTRGGAESTMARVALGTWETGDLGLSVRRFVGATAIDFSADYQKSDGHRAGTDYEITGGRVAVEVPVLGRPIHADVAHSLRRFGADGFYGQFPSFEATRTTTAAIRYRIPFDTTTTLEPIFAFRRNSDDFILYRDNPAAYRNLHRTDQYIGDLIARTSLLSGALRLAAGAHTVHDRIRSENLGDHAEWSAGGSLEVAAGQPGRFSMTGGLRADRVNTGDFGLSPSISAGWQATDRVRVRSSFGRSFRAPTWTERYYEDPQNIGNPDLTTEKAWTGEAGLEILTPGDAALSLTGYLRRATDLIDWARPISDPEGAFVTRNVESADFRGFEFEVRKADLGGFDVQVHGSWISLTSKATSGFESRYALRPQVDALTGAVERSFGPVTTGVRASKRRRIGEPAYTRVDVHTGTSIADMRVTVDFRNLLDEQYLDITGNHAPGRNLRIGLEWGPR